MEELCVSEPGPVCAAKVSGHGERRNGGTQHRRKYIFSDQADQLIREAYLSPRNVKGMSSIHLLAKRLGMPHWALKKRARELGLARTKELPWSEPELEILARYAWMPETPDIVDAYSRFCSQMASDPTRTPSFPRCTLRRHSSEIRTGCAKERPSGTVRGATSNGCPYRDRQLFQRRNFRFACHSSIVGKRPFPPTSQVLEFIPGMK